MTFATSPLWTAARFTPPPSQAPVGRRERTFGYLGMVLMVRCNLRCVYGLPEDGLPVAVDHKSLRTDEILPVIALGANLNRSVRKRMIRIDA